MANEMAQNTAVRVYFPHVGTPLEIASTGPLSVGEIRARASSFLHQPLGAIGVCCVLRDTIQIIPPECDDLLPCCHFQAPFALYCFKSNADHGNGTVFEYAREAEHESSIYNIEVVTFSPAQSQIFHIGPAERVSDLISRVHLHSGLQTQSAQHIRLQSDLPDLPILASLRSVVRDLVPRNSSIYAFATSEPEPLHREIVHVRRRQVRQHSDRSSNSIHGAEQPTLREGRTEGVALRSDLLHRTTPGTDSQDGAARRRASTKRKTDQTDTLSDSSDTSGICMRRAKRQTLTQVPARTTNTATVLLQPRQQEQRIIQNIPFIPRAASTENTEHYDASISDGISGTQPSQSVRQTSHVDNSITLEGNETSVQDHATCTVIDEDFKKDSCCNCKRTKTNHHFNTSASELLPYEPRFVEVNLDTDLRIGNRRKFVYLDMAEYELQENENQVRQVLICAECYGYLSLPPESRSNESLVWPAFIWSTLVQPSTYDKAWNLLPLQWKQWWLRGFSLTHQIEKLQLMARPCAFMERSASQASDLAALDNLRWAEDILPREQSFVLAEVKCPAGCSEFKHKTNAIPLDIVFQHLLSEDFVLYSATTAMSCTNWFRDDYLTHERILWNNQWMCTPSIAYCRKKMVPTVLTCRNHTVKHKRFMLHPCRHPLGSIATEKSSQFSPVTPVPRTLKAAEYAAYSGSFRVAKMEGSFSGLDTMFLSADGGYHDYQSVLAWKYEQVATAYRSDLRAHVQQLQDSQKLHPLVASSLLVKDGRIPNQDLTGSTFVDINDAVRLQNNLLYGRKDATRIVRDNRPQLIYFRGHWPRHLVRVHPGGSSHGALPFIVPSFSYGACAQYDARSAWIICHMMLSTPELWESVTSGFKYYDSWEAWTLSFLGKTLQHLSLPSRDNPFRVKTQAQLFHDHIQDGSTHRGYHPAAIYDKFNHANMERKKHFRSITCQYNTFVPPENNAQTIAIIVNKVLAPRGQNVPRLFTKRYEGWELRFVSFSNRSSTAHTHPNKWRGAIYMRHGGPTHKAWWRIGKDAKIPTKKPTDWTIPDLKSSAPNWNVCIFVRQHNFIGNSLRDKVLHSCGGQTKLMCGAHRFPLIISGRNADLVCLRSSAATKICLKLCRYRCPVDVCPTALCKDHFQDFSVPSGQTRSVYAAAAEDRNNTRCRRRQVESGELSATSTGNRNGDDVLADGTFMPIRDPHYTNLQGQSATNDAFATSTLQGTDDLGDAPTLMDYENFPMMSGPQPPSVLPTTSAQEGPVYANITTSDLSENKMTNHALLNCYGSCLVRRNAKLSGTLRQRSFLQRLVATKTGTNVPLVYPEAMLFTDIFYASNDSGSVLGALPAALLHGDGILRRNGFATLQEHYCCRLMSPGLLTSSNPKYHFWAFDALANFSMRGNDSRVILQRGFAEMQDRGGVRFTGIREPIFDSDHVECRSLVNKICATCAIKMPTYFYTHTCSMMTHFGIRILWNWLTDDEIERNECLETTEKEIRHWKKCLIESSGVYLLRAWMEIMQIWLLYITKSPEEPAGKMEAQIARIEFQPTLDANKQQVNKGNLPHMHCLFYTTDNLASEHGLQRAVDRIRGYVDDLVRPSEATRYLETGIFSSHSSIEDFKATMQRFLDHKHNHRCFVVKKSPETGHKLLVKTCKATHNWKITPASAEHTFRDLPVEHSQEAIRVMIELGVAHRSHDDFAQGTFLRFIPAVDFLRNNKHIPPCLGKDGIMSPVLGVLVALNPNSDNCQLASGYYVARYLAKYVIKIDQYLTINFSPDKNKTAPIETFSTSAEQLHNTKITSNAIAQKESLSRGYNGKVKRSLGINITDAYMKILGYPTIFTDLRHVRYSTETYENRAAKFRKTKPIEAYARHPTLQAQALTPLNTIPAHFVRQATPQTPSWRHFTEGQINKAFDDLHSPLTADPVTIFGRRCPELHFVRHQRFYFRWFKTTTPTYTVTTPAGNLVTRLVKTLPQQFEYCSQNYSPSDMLERTQWISTGSEVILLRVAAIDELLSYFEAAPLWVFAGHAFCTDFPTAPALAIKNQIGALLQTLKCATDWCLHGKVPLRAYIFNDQMKERYRRLYKRFLTEPEFTILPTPWTTPVRPKQPIRFLIHLLFSYGGFIDEYTLFANGSLYAAFVSSGLLNTSNPTSSAKKLMQKYFHHELKTLPAGTPTFDRYCVAANNIITTFFHDRSYYCSEPASVLYCRLKQDTTESINRFRLSRRRCLVTCMRQKLFEYGIAPLPTDEEFYAASLQNPLDWDITSLQRPAGQPQQSYNEQAQALRIAKARIDSYINATVNSPSGCCFVGGGGVGKTTCAMISLLYACSKGLTINATALVSERAQELGVPHLNSDFCIPRADLHKISTGQLAERIISMLYKKPDNLEFHRTVDVEFVDEMGPIAAELWNARDIVLRYIRNSIKPNGGKLDIVTFDHLQTHPIQGTHPLLSPFLTSTYTFHRLLHAVRASHNAWRRIQEITRLTPSGLSDPIIEAEFVELFTTHCNFVPREEDAPEGSFFVYGKNAPVRKKQRKKMDSLEKRVGIDVIIHRSKDIERTFEGNDREATPATTRLLDSAIREPSCLYLYVGGRYRITYNHKSGLFSNGQLAFLHVLPSTLDVQRHRPIPMLVAPPGCNYIPTEKDRPEFLIDAGWTVKEIGICPDNHASVGSTTAKRTRQYGLQLYVGSTWHSTMGKTLAQVTTQVSFSSSKTDPYSIWDPTQVVVMLSRTRLPRDTTFITTNPHKTAKRLFSILKKTSPLRNYLAYLVDSLCGADEPGVPRNSIDQSRSIFVPRDVLLPPDNTGFVYLLVSLRGNVIYIGSCFNLILRLQRHNSGFGATQTAPESLRPWAVMAYICGFQGSENHFRRVENDWIAAKNRQLRLNRSATASDIVSIGHAIMENYNNIDNLQLRFVHAGALREATALAAAIHSDSPASEQDEDTQFSVLQDDDNALTHANDAIPVHLDNDNSTHSHASDTANDRDLDEDSAGTIDLGSVGSDLSDHGRDDHFFGDESIGSSGDSDSENEFLDRDA